jgi:hypothetical protein
LGDRSRIGNVERKRFRLASIGANPGRGLLGAWTIDVGADCEGARCSKSFRRRKAYTGSRSRYESNSAIQPE